MPLISPPTSAPSERRTGNRSAPKRAITGIGAIVAGALISASSVLAQPISEDEARVRAQTLIEEFPHRLPNLRHLTSAISRTEVLYGLLNRDLANSDAAVFIGSSFMWGYPMREELTLPHYYSQISNINHKNYSLYGSGTRWIVDFICYLEATDSSVDTVLMSIPFTNDVLRIANQLDQTGIVSDPIPSVCGDAAYDITLAEAIGGVPLEEFNLLMGRTPNNEDRERFAFAPLDPDYFVVRERYDPIRVVWLETLAPIIARVADRSEHLTILVPPVFMPAVEQAGFDPADVQIQIDDVLATCLAIADGRDDVACFSAGADFMNTVDYFANLTHPNARGFEELARQLTALDD